MKITIRHVVLFISATIMLASCASKKRKSKEPSMMGKLYHNTTAQYNGYFNANEILKETYLKLEDSHQDNYTEILPLYDYTALGAAKPHEGELDRAIEKVTTVALLHEPSSWVDDCYVLMGEAQFLKQDFETAEETFLYFKEEFDPTNPFGRNYQKKKVSKKALKRQREKERKEKAKAKDADKKLKKKEREQVKKDRETAKKQAKKEREAEQKRREKEKKERAKSKSKKRKKSKRGKKRRPKKEPETKEKEKVEEQKEEIKEAPKVPVKTAEERDAENEALKKEEDDTIITANPEKKPKKKKIDKTAYSEGLMWLARTYVERDKYSTAKYLVRKMQNEGGLPKDVERELPIILADVYIREKNYEEALFHLESGIQLANSKRKKARYAFVGGQLSDRLSKPSEAGEFYANAKKWSSDFRMEFMAQLNGEKSSMKGGKSKEAVLAKLDGMIKEKKYESYLDQLYFTKGEILLEANQFADALASFRTSNENNFSNNSLKVETYYKLATLFYGKEDYVEAKYHYDSTLTFIDKKDERYPETKKYSENLTEIANLITTIELQDSLLNMAKLSDGELKAIAIDMVEKGLKAKKASVNGAPDRKSNLLGGGRSSRSFSSSNYWAYNEQTRIKQADEFREEWGDIALQDDWRRSDSQSDFGDGGDELVEEISEEEKKEKAVDQMMVDIKKQLPYSPKQKTEALSIVSEALFELGKQYRDKLNNYDKAIDAHEELLERFVATDRKLDTYYYLYLSNLEKPDGPRADYYKNKLTTEYPDSEYAKVITDPAYAATLDNEEQKLENYYRETYAAFTKGDYQTAYNNSKDTDAVFGKNNPLKPKFSLLNAMALGSIQGKEVYVKALRGVISKHPNTPEKARAEEIMRFLQGDSKAFDNADMKEVDDIFSQEDNLKHYIAIVMYDAIPANFEQAKIAVSEYNKKAHKDKRLQQSDSSLNKEENTDILLVRKFKNKAEAMSYYSDVIGAGDDFIPLELGGYSVYAVTQRNYRKMVIEKSDSRYRQFFNKYYLEQ